MPLGANAAEATQIVGKKLMAPSTTSSEAVEMVAVTDEMKEAPAYGELRETRNTKKLSGIREKMKKEKDEKKK